MTQREHIRILFQAGVKQVEIARIVGCSPQDVSKSLSRADRGYTATQGTHRCPSCRANITTASCLKCDLDAGRLSDKVIGATEDVPGQPCPEKIAEQCREIRRRAPRLPQGCVEVELEAAVFPSRVFLGR